MNYRQRWHASHRGVLIALLRDEYAELEAIAEAMPAAQDDSGRQRPCTAAWLARDIVRKWMEARK